MNLVNQCGRITIVLLACSIVALGQPQQEKRTLVVNGHSGEATVLTLNGKAYVDLETLARIGNGTLSFRGDQIVVTLSDSTPRHVESHQGSASAGMSPAFMSSGVQFLGRIKEWTNTLAYAAQRGVPGDGSRLVVFHDTASEALRLSKVAASTDSDHSAAQLLANLFDIVKDWNDKLIGERKTMNTGRYSMTPDALDNDENYRKIGSCAKFLSEMLPSGHFQDESSCH
jgi:hypothetical protein